MKCRFLFLLAVIAALVSCKKDDIPGGAPEPETPEDMTWRLDKNGTANCYIVSEDGVYRFPAVKGDGTALGGTPETAEVLWRSYGDFFYPGSYDIVNTCALEVTDRGPMIKIIIPMPLKNGNFLVAAKDADGKILWSWHIWVCGGFDPESTAQEYYGGAGKVMDRNLGALSATPGDDKALGLLYQWGRKDPFLGPALKNSNNQAFSDTFWPTPVACGDGIDGDYAREHPMTFITSSVDANHGDWNHNSRDISLRWLQTKTVNDPCPAGWKVFEGRDKSPWSVAYNSLSEPKPTVVYDASNRGYNFSGVFGDAETIWYPSAGDINYSTGKLEGVGSTGCIYTTRTADYKAGYVGFDSSAWYTTLEDCRGYGLSIRCVKE